MNKQVEAEGDFGVRWHEVNRRDEVVTKEKFFPTASKRDGWMGKQEQRENFIHFVATSDNPF